MFFHSVGIHQNVNKHDTHFILLLYELEVIIWVASFKYNFIIAKIHIVHENIILGHDDTKKDKNGWQWT